MSYKVEFDCPFCGRLIQVRAEELSPEKAILCAFGCKNLIPAGIMYDIPTDTSNKACNLVKKQD